LEKAITAAFIREAIRYYLPYLKAAGDYSLQIRTKVRLLPPKGGTDATPISEALTDADLSIQNFLEVAALANHPEFEFIPEEASHSLNLKYFPSATALRIFLDPINNTRYYADNSGEHDIILTFAQRSVILGAVVYIPDRREFYIADSDVAYYLPAEEIAAGGNWRRLDLRPGPDIVLTYRLAAQQPCGRTGRRFALYDSAGDYTRHGRNPALHDIFVGKIGGFFCAPAPGIDWGAIGFISAQAGCVLTDYQGKAIAGFPLDGFQAESLICATDRKLAQAIMDFIGKN